MKKHLIILSLLMALFTASSFAQTGIYAGGIWKDNSRQTGPLFRPEIGIPMAEGSGLMIDANLGSQITKQIYVGGGLGINIGPKHDNEYTASYRNIHVPLYADGRFYFSKSVSALFIELKLGLWLTPQTQRMELLLAPAIGFDIHNFDIKFESNNGEGLWLRLGYNIPIK